MIATGTVIDSGYKSGRKKLGESPVMRATANTRSAGTRRHFCVACRVTSNASAIRSNAPSARSLLMASSQRVSAASVMGWVALSANGSHLTAGQIRAQVAVADNDRLTGIRERDTDSARTGDSLPRMTTPYAPP